MQVNNKAGLTFSNALRSILRSDPDVVLVGEIRDNETAIISIEAALTGHLVLSTLHTNDAPSALTRLTEIGAEPFLVATALEAVVAQRLARRLCTRCREPFVEPTEVLTALGFPHDPTTSPQIFRAGGCPACSGTGYRGRVALHEVMTVTEEIEQLVVTRATGNEMRQVALEQGMIVAARGRLRARSRRASRRSKRCCGSRSDAGCEAVACRRRSVAALERWAALLRLISPYRVKIGRYSEITMPPIRMPSPTISTGSIVADSCDVAVSTSSS